MSKQVLISLLRQGNTGNEILSILDALVADSVSDAESSESFDDGVSTAHEIEF